MGGRTSTTASVRASSPQTQACLPLPSGRLSRRGIVSRLRSIHQSLPAAVATVATATATHAVSASCLDLVAPAIAPEPATFIPLAATAVTAPALAAAVFRAGHFA